MGKKAGIWRGKRMKRNQNLPHTNVRDWGFKRLVNQIDNSLELLDERRKPWLLALVDRLRKKN